MNEKQLIQELFEFVSEDKRCPNIRRDETSPYCTKGLVEGGKIGYARRYACDTASLQLWCLDKERCGECIFYQGEEFKEPILGPEFN